jgi:hypothetical protein
MEFRFLILLPVIGCLTHGSCAWQKAKAKPAAKAPAAQAKLVGRIASLPADRRFVLIQSYGVWTVATGAVLVARGPDERTANLLVTGEALGQFAAADIQSGTLEVGDAVFFLPPPATPPSNPHPPPGNPPAPPPVPVVKPR